VGASGRAKTVHKDADAAGVATRAVLAGACVRT
jgi:hypothetical protein